MKLIVAGSRDITISVEALDKLVRDNFENVEELVSGCAKGIDSIGLQWATNNGIPIKRFIPDWSQGKGAAHIRNRQMGDYADEALVIYNGSRGSQGMIDYMKKINKRCVVIKV